MNGRTPTKKEKLYIQAVLTHVGCIACIIDTVKLRIQSCGRSYITILITAALMKIATSIALGCAHHIIAVLCLVVGACLRILPFVTLP